jgi:orotidine-5'-phosphate decarboxylase
MTGRSWVEIVAANVAAHGEIVVGIDPHLPDIPAVFEQGEAHWLPRYLDFVLDAVTGAAGFVKFQ